MSCPRLQLSELLVQQGTNESCSYPELVIWLQAWFFLQIRNCTCHLSGVPNVKRLCSKSLSPSCCSSCTTPIAEKVCMLLVPQCLKLLCCKCQHMFCDFLWSQQLTIENESKRARYVSMLLVAVTRSNFASQLSLNLRLIAVAEAWPLSGQVG